MPMSSSGIASFRDRTAEFRARVERLQQESKSATPNPAFGGSHSYPNGLSSSAALSLRPGGSLQEHPVHATSKFNQAAKQINDAILLVTERLEKLAALARQRSLYNDPVTEINRLTGSIKQDLVGINRDIDTLSAYMASKGSDGSKHSQQNSKEIVTDLKAKLADTSKNFTAVLKLRTQNLKEQSSRRTEYESASTAQMALRQRTVAQFGKLRQQLATSSIDDIDGDDDGIGSGIGGRGGGFDPASDIDGNDSSTERSSLINRSAAPSAGSKTSAARLGLGSNIGPAGGIGSSSSTSSSSSNNSNTWVASAPALPRFESLLEQEDAAGGSATEAEGEQAQELMKVVPQDDYLQSRAMAVDSMRSTIEEIATMYRRLNELVLVQEEITMRIDSNIEDTVVNVEEGHKELLTYMDGLQSNQWLILKIFAVLIVFAILFVTFIA